MRAMVVTQFGPPEVLQLRDAPEPVPGEHDLLIEVRAAALNPVDFKIRKGAFGKGRKFPFITGYDASGVVRGVGAKASGFKVGDEVFVCLNVSREGAAADFTCADARTVALKPRSLDHAHAAAMPLVTLTAWEALHDRVKIQSGETVLIHAGAGGVGHIAVQLAKLRGCRVITTAGRPESIELCKSLGADVVIDYNQEDFVTRVRDETAGKGCPVVFDCVGFETFDRSFQCIAVDGRMVTVVGTRSTEAIKDAFVRNITLHFEFVGSAAMYGVRLESQANSLKQAAALVDDGKLKVHVSKIFDLKDLAEAHRMIESGHVAGKIAIRVKA